MAQFNRHVVFNEDLGRADCRIGATVNPYAAKLAFTKQLFEWLAEQGVDAAQLDALLLHQPNGGIIRSVQEIIGPEKVYNIAEKYGNLICA